VDIAVLVPVRDPAVAEVIAQFADLRRIRAQATTQSSMSFDIDSTIQEQPPEWLSHMAQRTHPEETADALRKLNVDWNDFAQRLRHSRLYGLHCERPRIGEDTLAKHLLNSLLSQPMSYITL
jgi:hypothetical protein